MERRSDDIGGLSTGMINLIVILVIIGAGFFVAMGYGFSRFFAKSKNFDPMGDPSPEQLQYMRQVRYRTRLGMYVAGQDAMKAHRDSRVTDEGSSFQV